MKAITVVVKASDEGRRLKVWKMLHDAGLHPSSPDTCEEVHLDPIMLDQFEDTFHDFVISDDEAREPFWIINLSVHSFTSGLSRLRELTHTHIPDELLKANPPIPAELSDCAFWPDNEEGQREMKRFFRPLSIAA